MRKEEEEKKNNKLNGSLSDTLRRRVGRNPTMIGLRHTVSYKRRYESWIIYFKIYKLK